MSEAKRQAAITAVYDALRDAPEQAEPDCAGGIACTTCPDKRKCQRGCIRQGEALENPDRKDLRAECDAVDTLLRGLGLNPDRCRTESGVLNARRALSLLADEVKAEPVGDALQIANAIDPFTRKQAPDHLTMGAAAKLLRTLATPSAPTGKDSLTVEPDERAEFEAWINRGERSPLTVKDDRGGYLDTPTHFRWTGWQARASKGTK